MAAEDTSPDLYDIVIVGGGLVGASLAVMLKHSGYRIAVIEAWQHDAESQPSYDDRTVALSHGSRVILDSMGLWQQLAAQVEAIDTIHISDRGHFGVTRLHAEQEGVEALGYVAENRVLGHVLFQALQQQDDLELMCPASVVAVADSGDQVAVTVEQGGKQHRLATRCLVAADGVSSSVREHLKLGSSGKHYGQSAVIANITPGKPHQQVAYERFTADGPVAMLPMTHNRCSMVWTLPQQRAQQVAQLEEADFLAALQQCFGYRLGKLIKVGKRSVYPLVLQQSAKLVKGRTVMVGNAAHAIHPVAGQGFNLALRDVSTLVDCLAGQQDPGKREVLERYQHSREQDTASVYRFTDALISVFSNDSRVLGHARAAGLFAVDLVPFIKHGLARQSMGLAGRLSSMGRS